METDLAVSDVMSRRLITADVSETADRLGKLMTEAKMGSIIITEGDASRGHRYGA